MDAKKQEELRALVSECIRRAGLTQTAKKLGISVESTLRYAGGFGTRKGTEALILSCLVELEALASAQGAMLSKLVASADFIPGVKDRSKSKGVVR